MRFLAALNTSALAAQPTAQLIILRLAITQITLQHCHTVTQHTILTAQRMAAGHSIVATYNSMPQQHTQHCHGNKKQTN